MTAAPPAGKVVGVGLACLDQLILWEDTSAPVADNRIVEWSTQGGGMVGTALVAAARLGARAEWWGAVGDDWMGRMILDGLRAERVDTSQVRVLPDVRGPMVVVCVDGKTGQREFLHCLGLGPWPAPITPLERLADAACLLIDNTQPASERAAARRAREFGIPVVGDLGRVRDGDRDVVAHLDYAIVPQQCAESVCQSDLRAACEQIAAMGPRCVVVTLGERGLVYLDGDRFGRMDAFEVGVVDTTGAGDTFHGAFCVGLTRSLPLEQNLAFASAAAALKCRKLGGRAGIPNRDEVVGFLSGRGFDIRFD